MINLFYITNNVVEAQIVDNLDIDWIFIDLESIGKKDRQYGRNTVLSNHNIKYDNLGGLSSMIQGNPLATPNLILSYEQSLTPSLTEYYKLYLYLYYNL